VAKLTGMGEPAPSERPSALVIVTLLMSLTVFALHLVRVRPYLWPAGAGITVSGDTIPASLSEPSLMPRIRPPVVASGANPPLVVTNVRPDSEAARLGVDRGMTISGELERESALLWWREAYRRGPTAAVQLADQRTGRAFEWQSQAVWQLGADARSAWLRQHVAALVQMAGFLTGAVILVALGIRGTTATLMTLAMMLTAIANGGPLSGAEFSVPVLGPLLAVFGWLATAFSFPVIGLAVLHFPTRAPVLDRHAWISAAIWVLPLPVLIVSTIAVAFLLGADAALTPLAWCASNGWLFDGSFALALAANVAIVIEGIRRYRVNLDSNERRRIQIAVYAGVAAIFAYAVKVGIPLVTSLAGRSIELPWLGQVILQAIVLLPAVALPYVVAVKHVFSPRTVLRRGLQYALARRTLSAAIVLPILALVVSLVSERDRPLSDIVLGQPLFYAFSVGLITLGLKYRDHAQRALDKNFFRAEYDAREILVALANQVPYENDPAKLVAVVAASIDEALHPESIAVLAGEERRLDVMTSLRTTVTPLKADSGLLTLLRWSEEPLEVFLDDERSPAARLPAPDRAWLTTSGVSLLVPIFAGRETPTPGPGSAGDTSTKALTGVIALGQKRSEEPYTSEDRKLLGGIAAQMSVAIDLSRLRKRASSNLPSPVELTLTPTVVVPPPVQGPSAVGMCPVCHRCYDASAVRTTDGSTLCPQHRAVLQPVIGMPAVVDGKYRIELLVGRGGMGAVFRARDLRLERDVAVKVVRADLVNNAESRARFQREAQIVARLQHPAIVTVFDYGSLPDGAAFLVMEYVRGEDLRHLLTREKVLPPRRTIELLTGIAAGVAAAHRAGVLHRDLKPENILLPESGTGPKVLDFGIAKITDGSAATMATQAATVVGTPAYMAPEQLRGETVDERADVYSLGVLAYEALTGRLPYGSGTFIDVAMKQAEGSDHVPFDGIPADLAMQLGRALSMARERRPSTAAAFAEELRLLL
jgi:aminoglycoside phosphotransferase (APT) family kinase protein